MQLRYVSRNNHKKTQVSSKEGVITLRIKKYRCAIKIPTGNHVWVHKICHHLWMVSRQETWYIWYNSLWKSTESKWRVSYLRTERTTLWTPIRNWKTHYLIEVFTGKIYFKECWKVIIWCIICVCISERAHYILHTCLELFLVNLCNEYFCFRS